MLAFQQEVAEWGSLGKKSHGVRNVLKVMTGMSLKGNSEQVFSICVQCLSLMGCKIYLLPHKFHLIHLHIHSVFHI